jgi:hypothetical protein
MYLPTIVSAVLLIPTSLLLRLMQSMSYPQQAGALPGAHKLPYIQSSKQARWNFWNSSDSHTSVRIDSMYCRLQVLKGIN